MLGAVRHRRQHAVVVMGVSGCGKSSVGALIAPRLNAVFMEGDELHPAENVEKMASGAPLTDADRLPWLDAVAARATEILNDGKSVVVSCSALRRSYRDRLRAGMPFAPHFLFLDGDEELLASRVLARSGHFMPTALLASQLETLERPTGEPGIMTFPINLEPDTIAEQAAGALQ